MQLSAVSMNTSPFELFLCSCGSYPSHQPLVLDRCMLLRFTKVNVQSPTRADLHPNPRVLAFTQSYPASSEPVANRSSNMELTRPTTLYPSTSSWQWWLSSGALDHALASSNRVRLTPQFFKVNASKGTGGCCCATETAQKVCLSSAAHVAAPPRKQNAGGWWQWDVTS